MEGTVMDVDIESLSTPDAVLLPNMPRNNPLIPPEELVDPVSEEEIRAHQGNRMEAEYPFDPFAYPYESLIQEVSSSTSAPIARPSHYIERSGPDQLRFSTSREREDAARILEKLFGYSPTYVFSGGNRSTAAVEIAASPGEVDVPQMPSGDFQERLERMIQQGQVEVLSQDRWAWTKSGVRPRYVVHFNIPQCTCDDWIKRATPLLKLNWKNWQIPPCKHIQGVIALLLRFGYTLPKWVELYYYSTHSNDERQIDTRLIEVLGHRVDSYGRLSTGLQNARRRGQLILENIFGADATPYVGPMIRSSIFRGNQAWGAKVCNECFGNDMNKRGVFIAITLGWLIRVLSTRDDAIEGVMEHGRRYRRYIVPQVDTQVLLPSLKRRTTIRANIVGASEDGVITCNCLIGRLRRSVPCEHVRGITYYYTIGEGQSQRTHHSFWRHLIEARNFILGPRSHDAPLLDIYRNSPLNPAEAYGEMDPWRFRTEELYVEAYLNPGGEVILKPWNKQSKVRRSRR